jgi:hypothetical protein
MKTIAARPWSQAIPTFWVSDLKPRGFRKGDWGYTTDSSKAIHLTPYWRMRFAADCRAVGVEARFLDVAQ